MSLHCFWAGLACAGLLLVNEVQAADINVIGPLTQHVDAPPGTMGHGSIVVSNDSDEPQRVVVYQKDYSFQADGSNAFTSIGTVPHSNGSWIHLSSEQFLVLPHQRETVAFTVAVPDDPTLEGTYWSLLMIEGAREEDDGPADGAVQVETRFRYAVQVLYDAPRPGAATFEVIERKLVGTSSKRSLVVDVANTGTAAATPTVWAELFDADGSKHGRIDGGKMRLLPDCSGRFDMDLTSLPMQQYTALVVVDGGGDDVVGSQYILDLR